MTGITRYTQPGEPIRYKSKYETLCFVMDDGRIFFTKPIKAEDLKAIVEDILKVEENDVK